MDAAQLPALHDAETESAHNLTVFAVELQMRRADGELRTIHLRSKPRRNDEGQVQWDGFAIDVTERTRVEEALREHRELLEEMGRTAKIGGWELDPATGQGRWTEEVARIHDLEPSTQPNKAMGLAFYREESRKLIQNALQEAIDHGTPYDLELEIVTAKGTHKWIRTVCQPVVKNGKVIRLHGSFQDTTDRKRAEIALRESERFLHTVMDLVPHFIFAKDRQSRHLLVNRACAEANGMTPEQMVGKCDLDFLPDRREAEVFMRMDREVIDGGNPRFSAEERLTNAAGQTRILQTVKIPFKIPGGGPALVGVAVDITGLKQAEAALRQSEENFRAMFEMASIGMAQADPRTGRFLRVNRKMCEITAYSMPELLLMKPSEITHPDDRDQDWELFLQVVRGEVPNYRVEKRYLRKDGSVAWVNVNMTVIRDAAGQPVRTMATIEDITGRKGLEARFQQAQKMEAIGQLAGGVAHDFNNILAALLMQVEFAASAEGLPEEARGSLMEISSAVERAANLTRQLLLFSRKQVMQTRDLDLNEVVASLAKMLQRIIGEDIRLQLHLHPVPLITRADAGMLDQILMNLAVNARDAMPDGGRLLIETGERMLDEASAQLNVDAAPGRYVWMSVTDTGYGIPPDVLPHIFEPFFTTKEVGKGTGLGLATVFGIVKQHQGWIEVQNQPGSGARFQVFFPVSSGAVTEPVVPRSAPRGGTETLLVVEDDAALRAITRRHLERHGYTVLEAPSGAEALQIWERERTNVALLLTDLVMPGGVSGQQLARKLQGDRPGLRVVFTSGYSAEIAGRGIQLEHGENFVQKPYAPDQLLGLIRQCLDS